jgi:precorrin-6A/cobalt-precorrin-6A reductase
MIYMKIFIVGGTKESIDIIEFLKERYPEISIVTSTTTEYGGNIAKNAGSDKVITRPLPKEDLIQVINGEKVDLLVDASHPFAEHITNTLCSIVDEMKIPFIRFEREPMYIEDMENINLSNVFHLDSFEYGGLLIKNNFTKGNILHLGGINTASDVLKYVSKDRFYIRVLKVKSSMDKCKELGIIEDHIFPMTASKNKDKKIHINENLELFKKVDAKIILTKESGDTGGFKEKIIAADRLGIKMIIIDRPHIKGLDDKIQVSNLNDFDRELNRLLNL